MPVSRLEGAPRASVPRACSPSWSRLTGAAGSSGAVLAQVVAVRVDERRPVLRGALQPLGLFCAGVALDVFRDRSWRGRIRTVRCPFPSLRKNASSPAGHITSPTSRNWNDDSYRRRRHIADYVRASMRTSRRITVHRSAVSVSVPISARPVGDGFVEPDLLDEATCLTRPRSVVPDGTSGRRACSSVGPSRQWLRSLAVLVEERLELVRSGMRSAISTDAAAGPGTGSRRAAGPRPNAADQGHVLQVGVRSQGMSVSDGQAAVHSGVCRSVGLGQNRPGARVESAGSKVGPADVPTLMPGLPHSAEPQWPVRHGVFSRLLTFTARRPATGSGVIAAARTTAARWPRSG